MVFVTRYLGKLRSLSTRLYRHNSLTDFCYRFVLGFHGLLLQHDFQNLVHRLVGLHHLPHAQRLQANA